MIETKHTSVQELFTEINEAKETIVQAFESKDMRIMVFDPNDIDRIAVALQHYKLFADRLKEVKDGNATDFIKNNSMFIAFMHDMLCMWAHELKRGEKPNEA